MDAKESGKNDRLVIIVDISHEGIRDIMVSVVIIHLTSMNEKYSYSFLQIFKQTGKGLATGLSH